MFFERIYDEDLAEACYLIGCPNKGALFVVDPLRDVDRYIDRAAELGFRIAGVFETHIHADFVAGGRGLARATGARLYVSAAGREGPRYEGLEGLDVTRLEDGDVAELGSVRLEAKHTPGHTPEHLSYLVFDANRSSSPRMLLSGDFAFVGDVGRPDLLEKFEGGEDGREAADELFSSIESTLAELPADVQLWPNHGAGSACGKALGSVASSTVGFERRSAWWATYVESDDRSGFAEELLSGQPLAPRYFGEMKRLNRKGAEETSHRLERLTPSEVESAIGDNAIVLDLRGPAAFAKGHADGAISLPSLDHLSTHAGAVVPYDGDLVVQCAPEDADTVGRKLHRVGFDSAMGWFPRLEEYVSKTSSSVVLDPKDAAKAIEEGAIPLDVRSLSEVEAGTIEGSIHLHYGKIPDHLDLSRDANYVVYCGSGIRANIALSLLERRGFTGVANGGGYAELNAEIG